MNQLNLLSLYGVLLPYVLILILASMFITLLASSAVNAGLLPRRTGGIGTVSFAWAVALIGTLFLGAFAADWAYVSTTLVGADKIPMHRPTLVILSLLSWIAVVAFSGLYFWLRTELATAIKTMLRLGTTPGRFTQLLDGLPMGAGTIDSETYRYLHVNRVGLEVFGRDLYTLQNMDYADLVTEKTRILRERAQDDRFEKSDELTSRDMEVIRPDGTVRLVRFYVLDPVVFFVDITDQNDLLLAAQEAADQTEASYARASIARLTHIGTQPAPLPASPVAPL